MAGESDEIKHSELAEEGIISDHLLKEIQGLVAYLPTAQAAISNFAKELSKDLKSINLKGIDLEGLRKLNDQLKQSNDLALQSAKLNKVQADAALVAAKAETEKTKTLKEGQKVQQEALKTSRLQQTEADRTAKATQKLTSAYAELNAKYTEARKKAQDLAAAQALSGTVNAEQTKRITEATIEANKYRSQLDIIDQSMGNYQRNVGNYSQSMTMYANTIRGLRGPTKLLGEALGIGAQEADQFRIVIEHALQGIAAFGKQTQEAKEAKVASTIATETDTVAEIENAAAHEANVFAIESEAIATEELAAVQKISALGVAGIVSGLLLLGAAVAAYIVTSQNAKEAEKERSRAIDGTLIMDEKVRESYDESILKLKEVQAEYLVFRGVLLGVEQEFENIEARNKEALRKIGQETSKKLEEVNGFWAHLADQILGGAFGTSVTERMAKVLEDQSAIIKTQLNKNAAEVLAADQKHAEAIEKLREKYSLENIQDDERRDREKEKQTSESNKKEINQLSINEQEKGSLLKLEAERHHIEVLKIDQKYWEINIREQISHLDDLKKLQEQNLKNTIALNANDDEKKRLVIEEGHAKEVLRISQLRDNDDKDIAIKREQEKIELSLYEKAKSDLLIEIQERHRKFQDQIDKDEIADLISQQERKLTTLKNVHGIKGGLTTEQDYENERANIRETARIKNQLAQENYDKEIARLTRLKEAGTIQSTDFDLQKKIAESLLVQGSAQNNSMKKQGEILSILGDPNLSRSEKINLLNKIGATEEANALGSQGGLGLSDNAKKQIDESAKIIDQITKGIEEGLQKRSEIQQQADQRDIDFHQRALEVQAVLAAGGRENTLAEEQAAAAQAEEKKLQDAKRNLKIQQNIALAETFSKTLLKGLESNKPFLQAFSEAGLAEGLVSQVFARLISGSYYEGTDDTGGRGNLDSKGGKLMITHPNEAVIKKSSNEETPGLAKKWNEKGKEGVIDWAFDNIYNPQFNASNSSSTMVHAETHDEKLASVVRAEIGKLTQAIESKPVQNLSLEGLGEWVDTMQRNNSKDIIHHKRSLTRPSLRLNG